MMIDYFITTIFHLFSDNELTTPFLMDTIMISVGSKLYGTSFWIIDDKFDEKDAYIKVSKGKRAQIELLYA